MAAFDEMHNHQMEIFKQFDDFSSKMFRRMDEDFGFGSLMPKFRGFDDIERQMMDFSDCKGVVFVFEFTTT